MTPSERKTLVEKLLTEQLQPQFLKVIDESHFHAGHAGAAAGASHFAVEINAESLKNISKLKQHQKIYEIVGYLIPAEIHALRIVIV